MEKTKEKKLWVDTPKRKLTRKRNWLKFRISGYAFPLDDCFSTDETILIMKMRDLKKQLLSSWDRESVKIGITPLNKKDDKD